MKLRSDSGINPAQYVASIGDTNTYSSPTVVRNVFANSGNSQFNPSQASGYDRNAPGGGYDPSYTSSGNAYDTDGNYGLPGYAAGYDDKSPEPFFTNVSEMKPVYASGSRSRYHRGRAVFAQTRYTPGEPVYPAMPVVRHYSKTSMKQSGPADAPFNSGF